MPINVRLVGYVYCLKSIGLAGNASVITCDIDMTAVDSLPVVQEAVVRKEGKYTAVAAPITAQQQR